MTAKVQRQCVIEVEGVSVRKSIFEILGEYFDFQKEMKRINAFFEGELFYSGITSTWKPEPLVDHYAFYDWKQRNRCINTDDMKEVLGISDILSCTNPTSDDVIQYLEYVVNILYLAVRYVNNSDTIKYFKNYYALQENINALLEHVNHEVHYFDDDEIALITMKNAEATAVADILKPELGLNVIKYNHHLLKGDIEVKKAIILSLANELEPKRKELEKIDKTLTSNLFYLLNNINLRHNNKSKRDKNYKEYVAKMKPNQLEKWYDETYQLQLLAFLLLDNVNRSKKIDDLKVKIEEQNND
jgi:hypothetical protein